MSNCVETSNCNINEECIDNICQNTRQTNENTLFRLPRAIIRFIISPFLISNENFDHLDVPYRMIAYINNDNREELQNMIDMQLITLQMVFEYAIIHRNYDLVRRMYQMRNIDITDNIIDNIVDNTDFPTENGLLTLIINNDQRRERYASIVASRIGNIPVLNWWLSRENLLDIEHLEESSDTNTSVFILTHTTNNEFNDNIERYSYLLFQKIDDIEDFNDLLQYVPVDVTQHMYHMLDNNAFNIQDEDHYNMVYQILQDSINIDTDDEWN